MHRHCLVFSLNGNAMHLLCQILHLLRRNLCRIGEVLGDLGALVLESSTVLTGDGSQ